MDDEEFLGDLVATALREAGYEVWVARSVSEAKALLAQGEFDVALLDMHLPDGTGEDILLRLSDEGALTEAIMLTGDRDITSAVNAMKLGATDYLVKPTPLAELELAVGQAMVRHRLHAENMVLRTRLERHEPNVSLITENATFLKIIEDLSRLAASDLPILIQGEAGSGKDVLARAIHDAGSRHMEPFLVFDCGAVGEEHAERDLFGHERGAFEGATERRLGAIEAADRGTLFLDEIGGLPAGLQPKLLRALEHHEFSRLGSTRVIRSRARVISSSTRDLESARQSGAFHRSLFDYLNGITLRIPPLRERPEDILPLSARFLRAHGIKRGISTQALTALKAHSWPGNVRELQMVIRRAGALARGDVIEAADLPFSR